MKQLHNNYPHPIIAREGWVFIASSSIVSLIIYWLSNLICALPFILITLFILQFFRDPPRRIPDTPDAILSPADGKIISITPSFDNYQKVEALKVSIFMNVFNVHANRAPVDGKVLDIQYYPGKFINADFDKASTDNERNALIVELGSGQKITVVQIAGLIARRILCYTQIGAVLTSGCRFGFIRFGSRVDLYLPLEAKILVHLGQKVSATSTVIATLNTLQD